MTAVTAVTAVTRRVAVALGCVAAAACGESPTATPPRDAGPCDAAVDSAPPTPSAAAPELTDWDCPEGWLPERVGAKRDWAHAVCLPAARRECGPHERQGPGDADCRAVGLPCPPAGERFPTEEVARSLVAGFDGPLVHVDPAARPGGDGSREAPVRTLDRALGVAVAHRPVLLLAAGRHAGPLVPPRPLAVVGACPAQTTLASETPGPTAVRVGPGAEVALANLTVVSEGHGVWVEALRPISLRGVVLERAVGAGVAFVQGAAGGGLEDVVVRGVTVPAAGPGGIGLMVQAPVDLAVRGVSIEAVEHAGVMVVRAEGLDPLALELSDLVVRDAAPGVGLYGGPQVRLARVLVEEHVLAGLMVEDLESEDRPGIVGHDLVVRNALADREAGWSVGILARDGATLALERVVLEANVGGGLSALTHRPGRPVRLDVTAALVRRTRPTWQQQERGRQGGGLRAWGDVHAVATRAALLDNQDVAVHALRFTGEQPPVLELTDSVVAGTRSTEDGARGRGLEAGEGTQVTLTRVVVADNRDVAVLAAGWGGAPETRLQATDLALLDTEPAACVDIPEGEPGTCRRPGQDSGNGYGLVVTSGARAHLEDFEVVRATRVGVLLVGDSLLTGRRGLITDNGVGINLLSDSYDLASLGDDVLVYGNGVDAARQEVELPVTTAAVPGW